MRATIIASVDAEDEREAATAWLARWRPHLAYCSENQGCGCCVDVWDVDAPAEATAELPEGMRAMSEWTHPHPPAADVAARTRRQPKRKSRGRK